MSFLDDIFGGGGGKTSEDYINEIPGIGHNAYDPYVTEGRNASGQTNAAYDELMKDPTGFINKLMQNYKTSEGYNFQKNALTSELGNTAAAGGIAGTPLDQMNQGAGVQGLLSKDMQQFLENALGVYGKGLTGKEGVASRGYDASGKLADILGGAANQNANYAFQNEQQGNTNRNSIFSTLAKALGGGIAGGVTGGPWGALGGAGKALIGGK